MANKIKLIWDFRGADAQKTAEHHAIHLQQFGEREKIERETGTEFISKTHAIAFFIVDMENMVVVRDALLPHRGTLVKE